jgi:cation diffusion facilitator family transporter
MSPRGRTDLPPDKEKLVEKSVRIELWSFASQISIIIVLGLVMGSSQAMKAMWLEDMLSMIPTISVLAGVYVSKWQPDEHFNYGYRRSVQIGFLAGAIALLGFGLFLFLDSIYVLIVQERPTIATVELFDTRVWLGWLMIGALLYSSIPPFILGKLKTPIATELHDKAMYVSATIDKGDWLSGVAAVAGIFGIALGYWWADAAAGAFISYEIVRDGWKALKNSTFQLMDMRPTTVDENEPDEVIDKVENEIRSLPWVEDASIRLREVGDTISGDAFVVPASEDGLLEKLGDAGHRVKSLDWRIQDFNFIPVRSLELGGNDGRPDLTPRLEQ